MEARPPDRPRAAGGHVLVVEDNANYATWMSETLGREGYSVAVAVSGDEALRRIEERAPDVLLLDLRLTGQLDGWELLAVLRSRPETGALPVVVISAYDERGSSQALNVQDYLVKPVSNEQLESIVRRLMGTRDRPVLVVEDDEAIQRFIDESLT